MEHTAPGMLEHCRAMMHADWVLQRRRAAGRDSEARQNLDLRYAQGQVDRDTYLRMRADPADGASGAR
jgi:hypothetical protein